MNKLALIVIRLYQILFSPLLGMRCRFHPGCSSYAAECFQKFSFLRALWYVVVRLSKCHPFHPGGYDPVHNSFH